MATRVFELARELGVTSKVVLEKCRAEGLDVKNHMATLSAGLEATVREWFSEDEGCTAIETSEHVDLKEARKEARKSRRRSRKAEEEQQIAEAQAEAEVAEEAIAATAEAAEVGVAPEAPAEPEAPVETPAQPPLPAEEPQAEPAAMAEEPPAGEKTSSRIIKKPESKKPKPVKPAGPQVVPQPAKLKGPRVIRVEKPDFVSRPPSRSAFIAQGPVITDSASFAKEILDESEQIRGKKGKKRSPRRRGASRAGDGGEKLKEWRDQDLQERSERLAAAGGGLRRHRAAVTGGKAGAKPNIKIGKVEIEEPITVKSLSAATGLKSATIIKSLLGVGVMATVNHVITREQAELVTTEYDIELVVSRAKTAVEKLLEKFESRTPGELSTRAPVVTFLGHVDHGKTSLLDYIRNTSTAEGEAGGITQHIGAYRYDKDGNHVVFLDTPGHEAFTAMRARGANMTDVVVLVVAADDGVMPQTIEAISHAKAAKVPIVVALNKIDAPNANIQRALGQLAEYDLQPREWGGNTEVIQTSAVRGDGMDTLVETLSLEAELLELKAEVDAPASGYVIEAEMNQGRGAVARLLVRNGTLKIGDLILAGTSYGRVRQLVDDRGRDIQKAGPATPVEVSGLDGVPEAGDKFFIVNDIDEARDAAEERRHLVRAESLAAAPQRTLEGLLSQIKAGETNQLAIIVKADVQGSVEAIKGSLEKLGTDEARVNVLHAAVGGISTGDVALAEASNAIIIGFNVVADAMARQEAEAGNVDIRLYRVIYDMIEDIRRALEEGLTPEVKEEVLGHAQVRQTFKISRLGTIAGCYVTDGKAVRNAKVRITRNNVVIEDGRVLDSLKRFKDDAKEVRSDMECGVKVAGYDDLKEGDVLEFYQQVEVARKL